MNGNAPVEIDKAFLQGRRLLLTPFNIYVNKVMGGAHGSEVCRGITLQVTRSRIRFLKQSLVYSIDVILPAALLPRCRVSH
jgi:hypothetical protein